MNKRMEVISEAFRRNGFEFETREVDEESVLTVGFSIKNAPKFVNYVFGKCGTVIIRLYGIVNSVESKNIGDVLILLNEFNLKYNLLKFTIDYDNDVDIEYDLVHSLDEEEIGLEAVALFVYIVSVAEELFGECMSVIYGS